MIRLSVSTFTIYISGFLSVYIGVYLFACVGIRSHVDQNYIMCFCYLDYYTKIKKNHIFFKISITFWSVGPGIKSKHPNHPIHQSRSSVRPSSKRTVQISKSSPGLQDHVIPPAKQQCSRSAHHIILIHRTQYQSIPTVESISQNLQPPALSCLSPT